MDVLRCVMPKWFSNVRNHLSSVSLCLLLSVCGCVCVCEKGKLDKTWKIIIESCMKKFVWMQGEGLFDFIFFWLINCFLGHRLSIFIIFLLLPWLDDLAYLEKLSSVFVFLRNGPRLSLLEKVFLLPPLHLCVQSETMSTMYWLSSL